MAIADTVSAVVHLAFAGLWTGSVLYFAVGVLPLAREGTLDPSSLGTLTGRLTTVSRASALLLLLSGGHLAGTRYDVERLTGDPSGHLVLTMVALWLLLAALVEVGARRIHGGVDQQKVREPAHSSRTLFLAASAVAVGLLIVAGMLMS